MQDVNFCLMQCLIATDGYTCRPRQVNKDNFMEIFYKFFTAWKRKIKI